MMMKFARSIGSAFDSLTVDGVPMGKIEALDHFGRLSEGRKKDETWKEDLHHLVRDLMMGGSSIPAHTSGTTGAPKAMRIARRDLVNSARLTAETFGLHEGNRVLLCLPCAFIAGKMMVVRAMALGLDLHVTDPRGAVLENLNPEDHFRFAAMVPLQLHRAIQDDRTRVERQFDTILLGGGPVSEALEDDLQGLSTAVFHGYGSTETVTHVAVRRLNGPGRRKAYAAIGRVHFETDERGCLVVHTPHLSTKRHVTNDQVNLIDDRHFQWLGRMDHVILSGGKKFFPEQLERITAGVVPCPHYFTAIPHERLGQAVCLVLETDRGPDEVADEVIQAVMRVLPPHQWPRRIVALRAFPRTASGKIIRQRIA